jgi:hypothetical protein
MTINVIDIHAELGKMSQGKPTVAPVELIAKLALDLLRNIEADNRLTELERMYRLPDLRA